MFENMPRPLTEEEADVVMKNTQAEIDRGGLWLKICAACGASIGGRLAVAGKPTPEDLQYCACPGCGMKGAVRLEYVPPRGAGTEV